MPAKFTSTQKHGSPLTIIVPSFSCFPTRNLQDGHQKQFNLFANILFNLWGCVYMHESMSFPRLQYNSYGFGNMEDGYLGQSYANHSCATISQCYMDDNAQRNINNETNKISDSRVAVILITIMTHIIT